jgi:two-component system, OmpR family, response regulator
MRILVLAGDGRDASAIESALRLGEIEIVTTESFPMPAASRASRWRFAGWTLDAVTRQCVSPVDRPVDLTSSEYDLLTAFLRQPGRTLSRNALLRELRGRAWTYFDRSIDTLVARLRKKIDLDPAHPLIRSVRGVGYVFCASVTGTPDGHQ